MALSAPLETEEFNDPSELSWKPEYVEELTITNDAVRRMIIIDGCNVVPSGQETGKRLMDIKGKTHKPTARSLLIMVHKFMAAGFEVYVTLKSYYVNGPKSDHSYIFDILVNLGIAQVIEPPMDDDAVALLTAEKFGGAVVSRDKFRNQCYFCFDKTSKKRLIEFRFKSPIKGDVSALHLPENLLSWATDLSFSNLRAALAFPTDSDYELVKKAYSQMRRSAYFRETYAIIRVLNEFFHYEVCYQTPGCKRPSLPYYNGPLNNMNYKHFIQHYDRHIEELRRSNDHSKRSQADYFHLR